MRRMTSALASLAWTSVLLIGLPAALVRLVGWPLPRHMPTSAQWTAWAQQPLTRATLIDTAAILVWLMWAALLATVLATAYGHIARLCRHLPTLRLPGPLQSLSAAMLGTVAVSTSISTVTMPAAHAAVATDNVPHPRGPNLSTRMYLATEVQPPDPAVAVPSTPGTSPASAGTRTRAPSAPGGVHHVVVRGDTLWDIAKAKLGDSTRWREIYVLNRGRRQANGYALTNPDEIDVGWVLVLPTTTEPAGSPDQADRPHTDQPAPATGGPPTTASSPSTAAPAPSAPSSCPPAPAAPAPASPSSAASSPATHNAASAPDDVTARQRGVTLPSRGWVSLGLAATIAAAAALLRLQHRRRARLRFPIPLRTAPQPTPVPSSLATVDAAGSGLLDLDSGDTALPGVLPAPPTVAAPIGVDAHGAEVRLFDLPGPGLALAGPGAEPAARAVLAATLSTGILEHLLDRPIVVTTVGTLARLLPAGTPPVGLNPDGTSFDGERLIILDDPGSAVTHAEEEMIGRRRLLDSMGADTVAALNARADHFEQQPPHLLLLEADERHAARIRAVAAHRQALDLHWVILGPLDGIPTVEVNADGTVTAAPVPGTADAEVPALARLATLAAADLVDVLALVAEVAPRAEEGIDLDDPFEPAEPLQPGDVGAPDVEIPSRSADSPAPVRLAVLGPPSLATQHGPITSGVRSGSLAVLAVLAAHPQGRTYEEMAAVLHPTADEDTGVNRAHTDLNAVRSLLKKATGIDGKGKFIVHDAPSGRYRIDPDMIEVDLWRMLAAIQRANATEDEADCLAALREAADCYRGDFATGQDRAWTLDYATTYRYQILGAYARIAEILEADQPDQAIAALEQAIQYDPVNEELYQRLIRIHGRLGRPDAVRRTLRLLENRLADLGEAEVSEATRLVAARQLKPIPTRHR